MSVEPDIVSPSLPERFRQRLFMHQDGLLLTLFVTALEERGFFVHPGRGASSIRELVMRTGALPRITSGPQATTDGHSLHWTLGDHVKCRA